MDRFESDHFTLFDKISKPLAREAVVKRVGALLQQVEDLLSPVD